jgi:hypothetical protein
VVLRQCPLTVYAGRTSLQQVRDVTASCRIVGLLRHGTLRDKSAGTLTTKVPRQCQGYSLAVGCQKQGQLCKSSRRSLGKLDCWFSRRVLTCWNHTGARVDIPGAAQGQTQQAGTTSWLLSCPLRTMRITPVRSAGRATMLQGPVAPALAGAVWGLRGPPSSKSAPHWHKRDWWIDKQGPTH